MIVSKNTKRKKSLSQILTHFLSPFTPSREKGSRTQFVRPWVLAGVSFLFFSFLFSFLFFFGQVTNQKEKITKKKKKKKKKKFQKKNLASLAVPLCDWKEAHQNGGPALHSSSTFILFNVCGP